MHIYGDMTDKSSVDFLRRPKLVSPIKISKILTDNGSQFTDRFTADSHTGQQLVKAHLDRLGRLVILSRNGGNYMPDSLIANKKGGRRPPARF